MNQSLIENFTDLPRYTPASLDHEAVSLGPEALELGIVCLAQVSA